MQRPKVDFLTTALNYGGAETQLVRLAMRLKKREWNVRVISMLPPAAYVSELEVTGIPVFSLDMRRGIPDPRALLRLASILRRERPLVLHSHMVHANLLARASRFLIRTPVLVCTAHNIVEGGRLREMGYRLTDPLCDLTTQVSRAGLERYVRVGAVPRIKIRHIPNGVDTHQFRPNTESRHRLRKELGIEDEFVWLAVGRLEEAKDYPTMLKAFAEIKKNRPHSKLLIAGQGSLKDGVEKLARDLGLTGSVIFLGVRRDVPDLMNAVDAYVMSSAWEGMPMVLLEASAVGLPIVATDVGGNREVVLDGVTGFLVPPKKPQALAGAMMNVMDLSPEERAAMGSAGRKHIEANYSMDRVVEMWEALYFELLERKGVRV
ncbi:glycosyltransferase [Hydrogenibacillus sp. N12]|uniref:glycosyltransferase n=1 Tax=Hydrogenibacillus sp. N12 TaxID=2866627 RepID=UPI001C7DA237|nr:glycosyltransferase [Hydrogenibacillus sp. N12]QZA32871.1 glycosyltransferase [Hydrogenibacillus sp. N12]